MPDFVEKSNETFDTFPTIPSASQYILRDRRIYSSVQGLSAIPQYEGLLDEAAQPSHIVLFRSAYLDLPVLFELLRFQSVLPTWPLGRSAYLETPVLFSELLRLQSVPFTWPSGRSTYLETPVLFRITKSRSVPHLLGSSY